MISCSKRLSWFVSHMKPGLKKKMNHCPTVKLSSLFLNLGNVIVLHVCWCPEWRRDRQSRSDIKRLQEMTGCLLSSNPLTVFFFFVICFPKQRQTRRQSIYKVLQSVKHSLLEYKECIELSGKGKGSQTKRRKTLGNSSGSHFLAKFKPWTKSFKIKLNCNTLAESLLRSFRMFAWHQNLLWYLFREQAAQTELTRKRERSPKKEMKKREQKGSERKVIDRWIIPLHLLISHDFPFKSLFCRHCHNLFLYLHF